MNHSIEIHTTIPPEVFNQLNILGNGILKDGIVKSLEICNSKQYNTKSELMRIANAILREMEE